MFHSISVSGHLSSLEAPTTYPVIFFSNHQSWWDGFLMTPFFDNFGIEYYVMMEAANLKKFPFFQRVGVFGVDLESKTDRASALLYAARLLKHAPRTSRRGLLLYPHGKLVDPLEPWPSFQPGLESLIRLQERGAVFPVYIHIRMGKYPLPEVFLRVGKPIVTDRPTRSELEDRLVEARDSLVVDLIQNPQQENSVYLLPPKKHFRGRT